MTEQRRATSPPERPAAPAADERQAQRHRLAELLGRLLGRYWLRFRSHPPKTPSGPPGGLPPERGLVARQPQGGRPQYGGAARRAAFPCPHFPAAADNSCARAV
jgi:hypothetical protein